MRWFLLTFTAFASLLASGCDSFRARPLGPTLGDALWTPPEERGLGYADIDDHWRIRGTALSVRRDISKQQVLYAGAQEGASVTSLTPPRSTNVQTVGEAEQIYYNAFTKEFTLIGNPRIYQGTYVTSRYGPAAKLYIAGDGTVKERGPDDPEPDA